MPSSRHEAIIDLLREQPQVLRRALQGVLEFGGDVVSIDDKSESFGTSQGAVRAADLVLRFSDGTYDTLSVVVEVQLDIKPGKLRSWPLYATAQRARLGVPAVVVVITPSRAVAKWAAEPIDLGAGNQFRVLVLGPEQLPAFSSAEEAAGSIAFALLWALAQREKDAETAAKAAYLVTLAARSLQDQLFVACYNAVRERLNEAALSQLEKLMQIDPQNLATEFSRKHVTTGLVREAVQAVFDIVETRGFVVPEDMRKRIQDTQDLELLRDWRRRAITIEHIDELFED